MNSKNQGMNLNLLLALSQQPSRQEEGRTMDILQAVESVLKGQMDTYGFTINALLQKQPDEEDVDKFLSVLRKYAQTASQFEVLQKIKAQLQPETPVESDAQVGANIENEN